MLELTPENALDYLRERGQLGSEPAHVEALGWGVSNLVLRVTTPERRFILKQSRPQLRTREAWFSDIARVYREQEVMELLHPLLPAQVVPEVRFVDRPNYVFAMSHAPEPARVWKETLLTGEVDPELGATAGRVLGLIHGTTATRREQLAALRERTVFDQLRIDPFYRRVQERRPEVATAIAPLIEQLLSREEALCHGDFSPKNLLQYPGGFTLVDYETAHLGDPTMDLGFFLSHLLLKAIHRPAQRADYFALTLRFWDAYARVVDFAPRTELVARGIAHLGVCVLARIDGTSPVEYLREERSRAAARELGRKILLAPFQTWDDVLDAAEVLLAALT
jgi:5-methylthioribose kinase